MNKFVYLIIVLAFFVSSKSYAQTSQQNVLIEVFTGAWAGYTVEGAIDLESVLSENPNAFAINIHEGDGMEFTEGSNVGAFYLPAYPQAIINRDGPPMPRGDWADYTSNILLGTSVVTVSFDSVRYNPDNGLLDVYLKAIFTGDASGDLSFNCVLVEDHVTGSGHEYDQVNYYNEEVGHAYYGAGDPIVGYEHRYVARSFMGGAWGEYGSIPTSVPDGTEVTCHLMTIVPSDYDEDELSLLATINRYDGSSAVDRKILNVEKCYSLFPVEPSFSSNANTICKGETIEYSNTTIGHVDSWFWEFEGGDPATSTLENPGTITYPYGGVFYTKLTTINPAGNDMHSMIVMVDSVNTQISQTATSLISLQEDATYQWFTCNGASIPVSGETSQEYVLPGNGYYSVEIDNGNCIATSACFAISNLAIDESSLSSFYVYPNPSSGEITVEATENSYMEITNLRGQIVLTSQLLKGENRISLSLSSGMYHISVVTDNSVRTVKLVIE